ncbi:Gag-Pol polyprotein [Vitis vinifera]|uniref:Gag-Pol polyprotein n=1 Tax=Vitis vinifera TaxID=29760 RepID=A0A438FJV2_VITVI|nr:Gag-Pol polyprotein [Vitis vinifera]
MDLSIFEYLPVSCDIDLSAPSSPTSQIFDIDDEIAQHDSDDDSSSVSDSDPVDQRVSPAVGDTEIVDFGTADQPRELRIGSDLSTDERDSLIQLLRAYLDVFAWSYEDMPGLDPSIVQHRLPLLPHARPVKQKLRRLHPRWSLQVKEEIQKQLSVGFLSVVEYPEWLANVVPVPKKDGKVRVCVDFRDLNKANLDGSRGHGEDVLHYRVGTYCYRVMPFGLKNAGATYQRAATTLFHDMMHRDVEVYVDDMIVKSRGRSDHLAALESERGIEVDPDKIRAILDMPAPRTERESVSAHLRGSRVLVVASSFGSYTRPSSTPILVVSDVALGCMLAQLDDSGKDRAIYYLSKRMLDYETRYVMIERYCLALVWATRRLRHYMTEYSVHLISKSIRGSIVAAYPHYQFLMPELLTMIFQTRMSQLTSLSGWRMYFDDLRLAFSDRHPATNNIVEYEACILGLETALELGIRQMEVFGDSNLVLRQIQGEWKTRDVKLSLIAYLELLVARFEDLRYTHLPRAQNQFADALATLASMIDIPVDATVRPLLIESRSAPAYCCLIDDVEPDDGLPWYHDIYHFLRLGVYPEAATAKDKRALRQLATRFVICGETLYRRSPDGMLLLCLDRTSADRILLVDHGDRLLPVCSDVPSVRYTEISFTCRPRAARTDFTMAIFQSGWVEAASYARLTSSGVASFIRSHIICRYGVPHELISDRGVHFRAEVDTLVQRYGIRHHRSSAYRPQTNGAVEAANKNIKRILRRMVETSRDWSEKLPFALWAYRTSFRTSTGATPYSLVYGMEAMLPVEIEMGSLRVALEQQIPEADWAQARFDQLNLLDERRLRAADHVRAYQRKMARAFKKRVKPRPLQIGDLVLKVIRGLIRDPRGKFRPNWSGPYFIRELTPEGAAWLMDLDGNRFSEPTNVDQLKRSDSVVFGLPGSFMDPHGLARSSLTGCSSRRGHDRYLTEPLRSTQPGPHFSTLGFHHASPSGRIFMDLRKVTCRDMIPCYLISDLSYISMPYWGIFRFGGSLWIFAEVTCSRIDDSMLSDLRPIIHFDAIQGHISIRMRFTDHEGVACLSLFGEMSMFDFILSGHSEEPLLSHSARFILFCVVVIPGWSCLWCPDFPRHISEGLHIRSVTRPIGVFSGHRDRSGTSDVILGILPSFSPGGDRSLTYPLQFPSLDRDMLYSSH